MIDRFKIIIMLSIEDYRKKFVSSVFGFLWSFIQPIVTTLVLWVVFSVGFKAVNVKDVPYICWLLSGLVPWYFFSESVLSATNSLLEYRFILKQMSFPSYIIPIVKVISCLFTHGIFSIILIVFLYKYNLKFDLYWFQILYYFICLIFYILGLSWFVSAVRLFLADINELVSVLIQIGMWFTPILWNVDIIPTHLVKYFKWNPMFYIIQGYRDSLIYKIPVTDRIVDTLFFWIINVLVFLIGYKVFSKLKRHFNDVI